MRDFIAYLYKDAPDLWAGLALLLFCATVYLLVTP